MVSPVTMIGLAVLAFAAATPPFVDVHVTVNVVIALPLFAPGVNVTFNEPAATFTAFTAVGAAGAPTVTAGDGVDGRLVPRAFVALTVHV